MNLAQAARRNAKKMFAAVDLTPWDIDLEKFWSLSTRAPPVSGVNLTLDTGPQLTEIASLRSQLTS
jgi:hypothetical protein